MRNLILGGKEPSAARSALALVAITWGLSQLQQVVTHRTEELDRLTAAIAEQHGHLIDLAQQRHPAGKYPAREDVAPLDVEGVTA